MSNYPPPPQPDQQHYQPIYPSTTDAPPLLEQDAQQDPTNYDANLNQSAPYPKIEHETLDPNTSSQIEQRIEQLQQQQHLQSESPQHAPILPTLQPHPSQPISHQEQQPFPHDQSQPPQQDGTPNKVNRLRKACDSCSIRKVKCDESGPPCKACAALDIPCTFERPSRRRGPPNRHAEAIKRRRLESPGGHGRSGPSSPTHAAQALAALSSNTSTQSSLSAETILPVETIELLINDYFTYIYPLCPFPHEPSFREAWRRREDYNNRSFLALLASMMAALVASFPRKPRLYLKSSRRDAIFPNHLDLVDKCRQVCATARGSGYLESEALSVHDAATSYLLGLAGIHTFHWRQSRLYFGECLTILKALGLNKAKDHTYTYLGGLPVVAGSYGPDYEGSQDEVCDNITLQVGRRIFWTLFVCSRSFVQLGTRFEEMLIPPESPTDPYPPLPIEVDDFCIFPAYIEQQPAGSAPIIVGFNANVRIYLADQPISVMEAGWGVDAAFDLAKQKSVYLTALTRCASASSHVPSELLNNVQENGIAANTDGADPFSLLAQAHFGQRDPAYMNANEVILPDQIRGVQSDAQKAAIRASDLCTRGFIVEQYFNLVDEFDQRQSITQQSTAQSSQSLAIESRLDSMLSKEESASNQASLDQTMAQERENVVRELLGVLSNLDRINIEPLGDNFSHRVRYLAATLVNAPQARKGELAAQNDQYIRAFLDVVARLEHDDPALASGPEVDQMWNDVRDYQTRFAEQAAFSK